MERLFAVAAIGKKVCSRWFVRQLFPAAFLLTAVILTLMILASMIVAGSLGVMYQLLVHYNVPSDVALLLIAMAVGMSLILFVVLARIWSSVIQNKCQDVGNFTDHSSLKSYAVGLLNAFLDGFLAKK